MSLCVQENVDLGGYNTFRVRSVARYFAVVTSVEDVLEAVEYARAVGARIGILGSGSNILFTSPTFDGLILKNDIAGVEFKDAGSVTAGAGVEWDSFVEQCVARGLYGIENLSYIPGTVGASPVQNIGAYGVEVASTIHSVDAIDLHTGALRTFTNSECQFAYRSSFFKTNEGRHYCITHVMFALTTHGTVSTTYKDVAKYFADHVDIAPTLTSVRDAVIAIRRAKLPDVREVGTAGSFFKNPIITRAKYAELIAKYPLLPHYDLQGDADHLKIPVAWVLDNVCGFKGYRDGAVGVYQNQALVLVNFGGASSADIQALATRMIDAVRTATGITIEPEVEYVK